MTRRVPVLAAAVLMIGASGCGVTGEHTDVVAGKRVFVQKCGACHVLKRAGTQGVLGPNLDEAFRTARTEGFGQNTFAGVVEHQILYPIRSNQTDPATGQLTPGMPAKIVEGQTARDVAAYVASVAGKPGNDQGQLADIGVKKAAGTATAQNGTLTIPTDSTGQLAYRDKSATAPAGSLTIRSPNASQIPHNIALEGN